MLTRAAAQAAAVGLAGTSSVGMSLVGMAIVALKPIVFPILSLVIGCEEIRFSLHPSVGVGIGPIQIMAQRRAPLPPASSLIRRLCGPHMRGMTVGGMRTHSTCRHPQAGAGQSRL